MPRRCAQSPTVSSSMPISATRYGRRSPMTIASLMNGEALSAFSISLGAMFLPPAVMRMSLARSVILTWVPSTHSPTSPVCSQPSGGHRPRGRLGVAEVADERARMPGQDLAGLRVDPHLDAVLRLADRAQLDPARPVAGGDSGVLGHAVDLVHRHADAHEELEHLGRDRGGARRGVADPAHADPLPQRPVEEHPADRVDQPGGERCADRRCAPAWRRSSRPPSATARCSPA